MAGVPGKIGQVENRIRAVEHEIGEAARQVQAAADAVEAAESELKEAEGAVKAAESELKEAEEGSSKRQEISRHLGYLRQKENALRQDLAALRQKENALREKENALRKNENALRQMQVELVKRKLRTVCPSSVKSDAEFEEKTCCHVLKSPPTLHAVWERMSCAQGGEEQRVETTTKFCGEFGDEWDSALEENTTWAEQVYSTVLQRRLSRQQRLGQPHATLSWSHQMAMPNLGLAAGERGKLGHVDVVGFLADEAAVMIEVKKASRDADEQVRVQGLAGAHLLFARRAHVQSSGAGETSKTYFGVVMSELIGADANLVRECEQSPRVDMYGVEWENGTEIRYIELMRDGDWGLALAKLDVFVNGYADLKQGGGRTRLGRYVAHDTSNGKVYKVYPEGSERRVCLERYPAGATHEVCDGGGYSVLCYPFVEGSHLPHDVKQVMRMVEALKRLHEDGFVHGDIRASNMVFGDEKCALIDFDYGGAPGERRYPRGFNTDIEDGTRHKSATAGEPLEYVHDWYSMAAVARLVRPSDFAHRVTWERLCDQLEGGNEITQVLEQLRSLDTVPLECCARELEFLDTGSPGKNNASKKRKDREGSSDGSGGRQKRQKADNAS